MSLKNIMLLGLLLVMSSCSKLIMNQGFKSYKSDIIKKPENKSLNKYQQDLLFLDDLCSNAFPNRDSVFTDDKRKIVLDSLMDLMSVNEITDQQFLVYTSFYLSHFENQHTRMGLSSAMMFPFDLHFVNQDWYLWDINKEYDSLLIGKKLVKINNQPIEILEKKLFAYVSEENEINKRKAIRGLWRRADLLKQFQITEQTDSISFTFEEGEEVWIRSITEDKDINFHLGNRRYIPHSITKSSPHLYNFNLYPNDNFAYFQFRKCHDKVDSYETMSDYLKPWVIPFAKAYLNRQIKKKNAHKTYGYVDVERPVFKEYLEVMFDSIQNQGIENLIIDLRNNPGGSLLLCLQLMYHLTDRSDIKDFSQMFYVSDFQRQVNRKAYKDFVSTYKRKTNITPEIGKLYPNGFRNCDSLIFEKIEDPNSPYYIPKSRAIFKGKVIVLANYYTGSSAALLTTLLQDNGLAVVIGTPVGNNPIGATDYQPFKLPNTKFSGSIATGYLVRPDPAEGKYQIPDYWVENEVDDFLNGRDKLFKKALELLREP